jgi:hypothetical protein
VADSFREAEFGDAPSVRIEPSGRDLIVDLRDRPFESVRSAAGRLGISESTVRSWARRGTVESRISVGPKGTRLEVSTASLDRARAPGVKKALSLEKKSPKVEPEAVLVPLDAWQRLMAQLGNLHQAGQDLADARERAARAETQVEFLRERLAELRRNPDTGPSQMPLLAARVRRFLRPR